MDRQRSARRTEQDIETLAGADYTLSDEAIRRAQDALWSTVRIVAEPGGAAAIAALLSGAYTPAAGERVGVVVSGGNSTAVDFGRA